MKLQDAQICTILRFISQTRIDERITATHVINLQEFMLQKFLP